jgi:hypothetical protein
MDSQEFTAETVPMEYLGVRPLVQILCCTVLYLHCTCSALALQLSVVLQW